MVKNEEKTCSTYLQPIFRQNLQQPMPFIIIFISKTYLHSNIKVKFTRPFSGFHSSNKTTIELFPVRFFECRKPAIYYPLNVRFANFMILERCKYNLYVQVWAQKSNEKGGVYLEQYNIAVSQDEKT